MVRRGRLAPDLTLPRLRGRWAASPALLRRAEAVRLAATVDAFPPLRVYQRG